jgi:lambda repressor-like predicted transcriptional regulator
MGNITPQLACRVAVSRLGVYVSHMSNRKAAELATRIKAATKSAGLTTKALSDTTGIPYSTLNRKLDIKPETFTVQEITKISVALGVGFDTLLSEVAA